MQLIPHQEIESKILEIRNTRVMIDADIAELYGVETKALNQQVKRNLSRFPSDFMFELTQDEKNKVVTNCDHLKNLKFSKTLPKAFTEQGVYMLATVINTQKAIDTTIAIMRVFTKMRLLALEHSDLRESIKLLKSQNSEKFKEVEKHLSQIYQILDELINRPEGSSGVIGFIKQNQKEGQK